MLRSGCKEIGRDGLDTLRASLFGHEEMWNGGSGRPDPPFKVSPRLAEIIPSSARFPRIAFDSIVRCRTRSCLLRCNIKPDCCCSDFVATNRIDDSITASQIAAASFAVILAAPEVRLHVARWHQPHRVTECLKPATPMMSSRTCLNARETGPQCRKELQLGSAHSPADHHSAGDVHTMNLEY